MRYFLIAGEASGDLHGGRLIEALKAHDADAAFTFLGGDLMACAAGAEPLIHYRDMAYMGFSEVLRNLGKVRKNMHTARKALLAEHPDCLILIDYPSFNLKLAKAASKAGIPVVYYISPKLWAWKKWRIRDIRRYVDDVLCILPFEEDFYRAENYSGAVYVGNPSVEEVDAAIVRPDTADAFAERHSLRANRPFLALLPGSRLGEIRANLPVMDAVARQFPGYTIVVAGAPSVDNDFYAQFTSFKVIRNDTFALLRYARAALVTSGTATLETALFGVPQVLVYRSNGSRLLHSVMKRVLNVNYVGLPNLIADRSVIPEMLLHECTPAKVAEQLRPLTPSNSEARCAQLEGYAEMRRRLGTAIASERAASYIINKLQRK